MKTLTDATEIMEALFVQGDPVAAARVEAECKRLHLIDTLRVLREKAGLTQSELARKVGVTTARIARMEDPDYEGQSVHDLQTVVAALGMELELRIVKKTVARKRRAKTAGAA